MIEKIESKKGVGDPSFGQWSRKRHRGPPLKGGREASGKRGRSLTRDWVGEKKNKERLLFPHRTYQQGWPFSVARTQREANWGGGRGGTEGYDNKKKCFSGKATRKRLTAGATRIRTSDSYWERREKRTGKSEKKWWIFQISQRKRASPGNQVGRGKEKSKKGVTVFGTLLWWEAK